MSFVSVKQSAHYYKPDGTPVYEVPTASKPGEMRPTTLADARKMGLVPSVTTILDLLSKPFLNAWRVEQAIMSSLTLPGVEGESIDDRAKRIVSDSERQVREAGQIGTLLHESAENYITLKDPPKDPQILTMFQPFMEWWDANCEEVYYCETPVVGSGFAGRVDCKAKLRGIGVCIVDFKGRKFDKKTGKPGVYDEDCMQLSAYREADAMTRPRADRIVSILMNNVPAEPAGIHVHIWDEEDSKRFLLAFFSLLSTWNALKKYGPFSTT